MICITHAVCISEQEIAIDIEKFEGNHARAYSLYVGL